VILVSVADKLHNARATLADLRKHGDAVWERFNAGQAATLENYDNLIACCEAGPADERRNGMVSELRTTIDAIRKTSRYNSAASARL